MTKEEQIQKSIKYRGEFLHYVSILESYLNYYISQYFAGSNNFKKIAEMQIVILGDDRSTFGGKVQIFKYVAENHDKEWYDSYKSARKHQPKKNPYSLNVDLNYIIENRNIFAHRLLESYDMNIFKEEKEEDVIRFIRFKDTITPIDFTDKTFYKIIFLIRHISNFIIYRCNNIANSSSPLSNI